MTGSAKQMSYVFEAVIEQQTPRIVNGKGIRISVEKDGKRYNDMIDACTGAAVGSLGWADEDVYDIASKAIREHTYSFPLIMGNSASEKLAKFYLDHCPPGVFSSAFFCGSGSESNENALRIIRQYQIERGRPQKVKIISRKNSYHGFTLGSMSISDGPRTDKFKDILLADNICLKMPVCYPYREIKKGQSEADYAQSLVNSLEDIILKNDPDTISAVVIETLPGSSLGTPPPPAGYLNGIRALCNKYDIVFMLDEVMCGSGRCNPNGGYNCWENFLSPEEGPDIQTIGKTLGSGYVTIAGILVGPKIKEAFCNGTGMIYGSHTYASHGYNCAVALGIQEKIQRDNLTANIFKMGNMMGEQLKKALLDTDSIVGDVRGIGGFWSMEFIKDRATKEPFPMELKLAYRFQVLCFENGLSLLALQGNIEDGSGDIALLAPSFILDAKDVHEIVEKTVKCVGIMTEQLKKEGDI